MSSGIPTQLISDWKQSHGESVGLRAEEGVGEMGLGNFFGKVYVDKEINIKDI